ncbi:hypothetical protein [Shewanella aestuarii]|uniref:Uncharacterized protein n=1 Tax=Shewanella aestuarii TaxID=1028752 RepID=A0A6G9QR21_9GAMM|nr:hypothetical protein [Shewanella aestuarii]QIR16505.1 hypothetical protein HBH39_18690 [Shewanella aestuarii]
MKNAPVCTSRRRFFKVPIALVAGVTLASYSKPSNADPIQLIVQAMAEAAKLALDTAIEQIEAMMSDIWNTAFKTDSTKIAKVGDAINTTKVELFNQKIIRRTMPAPRSCDMDNQIDKNRNVSTDFGEYMRGERKSRSAIERILGDNRSYAAGIRDVFRDNNINVFEALSDGGLVLSPTSLFGSVTKPLTQKEEQTYRMTVQNLIGIEGSSDETVSANEGTSGKLKRKNFIKKANTKALALTVFEIDIAKLNTGVYSAYYEQINETYFSAQWRIDTAAVADMVPASINLYNQTTAKLDLLTHLLRLKEQTLVLTLIKSLQELA